MNIRYIRLMNGQQIIAELVSDTGGDLVLKSDILEVFVIPQPNGQDGVTFAPFALFTDEDTITIDDQFVMINTKAAKQVADHFKTLTNRSKIITNPDAGKIII